MGRTIALKLSETEEHLVTQLNKQGITNSELLRNALRHYFESLGKQQSSTIQETKMVQKSEGVEQGLSYSLNQLNTKMEELSEITRLNQSRMDREIARLEWQVQHLPPAQTIVRTHSIPRPQKNIVSIHQEVDDFLKKRAKL